MAFSAVAYVPVITPKRLGRKRIQLLFIDNLYAMDGYKAINGPCCYCRNDTGIDRGQHGPGRPAVVIALCRRSNKVPCVAAM